MEKGRWQTFWATMPGLLLDLFLTLGTMATHFRKWLTHIQRPLTVVRRGFHTPVLGLHCSFIFLKG